jgi:TetR/AcrR family transcriptional regulator
MVEALVFGQQPAAQRSDKAESGSGKPANRPRVSARVKNG